MSLDIFAAYATNETLENEGTWRDLKGGARVLVARAGNDKFVEALSALVKKNQQALDGADKESEALSKKLLIEVMATTILLGWEGIKFKGQDLPYSVDNAKLLLGVKDFRREVDTLSNDVEAYRAKLEVAQGEA